MRSIFFLCFLGLSFSACSQEDSRPRGSDAPVGGPCEGCEAIYEYGDRVLNWVDTLPGFSEDCSRLEVSGTVFESDGRTPAAGILIYAYHTDERGIYPEPEGASGWAKRHGYLRGWVKTDENGRYKFYTCRPGSYPGRNIPAHIHLTVKEPDINEYYIDDIMFEDDPLLSDRDRKRSRPKGGPGIVVPKKQGANYYSVTRDIILGMNIENY